jgi:multiple sugar transport system substrate-binding protein
VRFVDLENDRKEEDMAENDDELEELGISTSLTRRQLVRRGLGGFLIAYAGALPKAAAAGVPKYVHKHYKNTLKIIQWSHFVPAYDVWFDKTYTKNWGAKHDTDVQVDHIALAQLPARAQAEVAAQSGHDIFGHLSPQAGLEDQVINHKEIIQEVTRKVGKVSQVGFKSCYNPKTRKWHGFPENYVPDPIHFRKDLWNQVGIKPSTWDDVRRAAPKLKALGHPVGLGMSNELDSNMLLIALMQCYGAFIQNAQARPTINSKNTIEALKVMRDIYKRGMTNEVFAWTAASNNQGYLSGRLALAVNAISIIRSAEDANPPLAKNTSVAPIPRGPVQRLGLEHVMGVYTIWKFTKQKTLAKRFIADLEIHYQGAFKNSKFYNFPAFRGAVHNYATQLAADPHKGKYKVLDLIARKYTANLGYPGFSNAAIDEIFNTWLVPQMFAQVAQGKMTPAEAAKAAENEFKPIFAKWRGRGKI